MSRKIYDLTARCSSRRPRLQLFLAIGGRLCYNSVRWKPHPPACAGMMELADVTDSKSVGSDTVWVQVPLPAPRRRGRHIVRGDFFAKVTSRTFCRGSSPNRNRLRRITIWFWGTELKAKASMPMRFPTSGQSLFCSGSGGRDSGLLRREAELVAAWQARAISMRSCLLNKRVFSVICLNLELSCGVRYNCHRQHRR